MASAVHVFNRTPRRSGSTISPLEAITGKKPILDHLRVFGCPAYAHVPSQRRTKMSPPARKGIFVGYTPNSQSWMVYFPATRTVLSSRSLTFDEEWRPLSPSRPFPELHPNPGGAAPLEREPFLFKTHVNSGAVMTTMSQSTVLPPRPVAPTLSSPTTPEPGARILPSPAVTRSGHLFRADASPFAPFAALPVIHEGSDSSDSDDEDTAMEPSTPAAPQKQPAPSNRFLAPATSASTASAPIPPYEDAAATISTAAPQPLRRSQRTRHQPDWLTLAYLQVPQGRAPVPGSSAYATFPYPTQTVIPTFPQSFRTLDLTQSRTARQSIRLTAINGKQPFSRSTMR